MNNDNRIQGLRCEAELATELYKHRMWVHRFTQSSGGQPCDIIAINHKGAHLIDVKRCTNGRFNPERVEPNQLSSMDAWIRKAGQPAWFALVLPDGVRMLSFSGAAKLIRAQHEGDFSQTMVTEMSKPLSEWLEVYA